MTKSPSIEKKLTLYQILQKSISYMADMQKDILADPKADKWPRTMVDKFSFGGFRWELTLRRLKK